MCTICSYNPAKKSSVKQHLWLKHGVGPGTIYLCPLCPTNLLLLATYNYHMWKVHDIGDKKTYPCDICDFVGKYKNERKTHLWRKHNIGKGTIYKCDQCTYTTKLKSSYTRHLETHDVGDKVCELLGCKCFKLRAYKDKNAGNVKGCRKCYRKATGRSCRAEDQMVRYLEKRYPYIVLKDRIIAHDSCSTKRRPDVLISSGDLHIIVECDEKQHRYYNPSCEWGRMDEIIDELKTGKIVFIRWNPDYYKAKKRDNRKKRLDSLGEVIDSLGKKESPHISVMYMYYDEDNPIICNRWFKEMY